MGVSKTSQYGVNSVKIKINKNGWGGQVGFELGGQMCFELGGQMGFELEKFKKTL